MSSPMQQSLKMLREAGWHAEIVEYFHAFGKVKIDFCNFADIIFFRDGDGIHACQVFGRKEFAPHKKKILAEPRALIWLKAGGRILLHGWDQRQEGKRKVWRCKAIELTQKHFKKPIIAPQKNVKKDLP